MALDPSRRLFLAQVLPALCLPLASRIVRAGGPELQRLPPDNPQAKALAYTEDASQARNPNYKAGSVCANCQLFDPATQGCSIFPGFRVAPAGWCAAWAKRSG